MVKPDTTEDLARRAAAGDHQAFEALVAHFRPRLEGFVRSRSGRQVLATLEVEDVVQETLTKTFQCIERLRWQGDKAFFGWLASVAENIVLDASQRAARRPLELEREVVDSAASPSRNLRRQERFDRLQCALEGLSDDHRQAIVLARIDKLQIGEIAGRMNRSPNAVKKLLARALDELKNRFGDTESLHLPDDDLDWEGR